MYTNINSHIRTDPKGRYSHIPTEQRDSIIYSNGDGTHDLNVERRIFERDGAFNIDTKNYESSHYFKNNNTGNDNRRFGEITGEAFNPSDLEQGMPMRDFMNNEKGLLKRTESDNPHLDFNLYRSTNNIENVSYYDPYSAQTSGVNDMFSNVNEPSKLLSESNNQAFIIDTFNQNSMMLFNGVKMTTDSKSKIIMSPIGIIYLIIILYMGSSGDTSHIIKNFFGFSDKNVIHEYAKRIRDITVQSGFINQHSIIYVPTIFNSNNAFKNYVSDIGIIDSIELNNNSTNKINNIIQRLTNNTITNILTKNITSDTRLICLNTTIIRPRWKQPFNKLLTEKNIFHSFKDKEVQMMKMINHKALYAENEKYQLVELDLINKFMMGFLLPKQKIIPHIDHNELANFWTSLKEVQIGNISIPKFKYQCKYKIDSLLKKLGLVDIFINGDFNNMCQCPNGINVTDIIHNMIIWVDEGGVISYAPDKIKLSNINFIANHPFIFYIRHYPTNTIISIGMYC